MKAYIINLFSAVERKKHMEKIISMNNIIEPCFIEAVDGRTLTEEERKKLVDYDMTLKTSGYTLLDGEVGVTLSHYKIYKQIIDSLEDYAIIFEDDIVDLSGINKDLLDMLKPYYETNIPTVILLSGNYRYYSLKRVNNTYKIAIVFDAWLASGYIINKKAAEIITNEKPFWRADDWWYLKSKGVRIFGIKPHVVDQFSREVMPSYVRFDGKIPNKSRIREMSLLRIVNYYFCAIMRKVFRIIGFYEPEYRKK